jgi:hypothetical protein
MAPLSSCNTILIGPARCGKTSLLRNLLAQREYAHVHYITQDDRVGADPALEALVVETAQSGCVSQRCYVANVAHVQTALGNALRRATDGALTGAMAIVVDYELPLDRLYTETMRHLLEAPCDVFVTSQVFECPALLHWMDNVCVFAGTELRPHVVRRVLKQDTERIVKQVAALKGQEHVFVSVRAPRTMPPPLETSGSDSGRSDAASEDDAAYDGDDEHDDSAEDAAEDAAEEQGQWWLWGLLKSAFYY